MASSVVKPTVFRAGETATFGIKTDLVAPWKYQWKRNGVFIGGSHWAAYTTHPLQAGDITAKYSCVVFGQDKTEETAEVVLELVPPKPDVISSAKPSAIPAPSGLKATPGNAHVVLGWTIVPDVVNYQVKRGLAANGPYAPLATTVATAYTDSTALNATKYFYTVSYMTLAGESADSVPVEATPLVTL